MKIMAVDTDQGSLDTLTAVLRGLWPDGEIAAFCNPMLAVKYGVNEGVDLIFTEGPMRGVDGPTLIQLVRRYRPGVQAVYVTDAGLPEEPVRVTGCLAKPVTAEAIQRILPQAV